MQKLWKSAIADENGPLLGYVWFKTILDPKLIKQNGVFVFRKSALEPLVRLLLCQRRRRLQHESEKSGIVQVIDMTVGLPPSKVILDHAFRGVSDRSAVENGRVVELFGHVIGPEIDIRRGKSRHNGRDNLGRASIVKRGALVQQEATSAVSMSSLAKGTERIT